ncbi:MAG TPA: hypothetical protein VGE28_09915 [Pseudomonas sp.]
MIERSKVVAYEKDRDLTKLLTAWVDAVLRYQSLFPHDNCWWYNERATLSSLAGAAWSLPNWVALEEFSTQKRGKIPDDEMDEGELRPGRCDLFISNRNRSYAIEAKQAWQRIGQRGSGTKAMHRAQRAAWYDCWYLKDEADRRFAATFVVPTITLNEARGELDKGQICAKTVSERVAAWLEKCNGFSSRSNRRTSYAWVFPKLGKAYSNDRHHFPGVVLILEEMLSHTKKPSAPTR